MSNRITNKDIQNRLDHLNDITGHEREPYGDRKDGKINPNGGNYHLEGAYGGVKIVQMCKTGTGCQNITSGYETKRVCYQQLNAFIDGVKAGKGV